MTGLAAFAASGLDELLSAAATAPVHLAFRS
jgi:hypothetical protein